MLIIGIDPHRGSHMAIAIDRDERIVATIELPANQQQRRRLLTWARPLEPRVWAVEGARRGEISRYPLRGCLNARTCR
jgi:hypothetical protein